MNAGLAVDVAVFTAKKIEFDAVCAELLSREEDFKQRDASGSTAWFSFRPPQQERPRPTGSAGDYHIIVHHGLDQGPEGAARATMRLLHDFHPRFIIMIGMCAAVRGSATPTGSASSTSATTDRSVASSACAASDHSAGEVKAPVPFVAYGHQAQNVTGGWKSEDAEHLKVPKFVCAGDFAQTLAQNVKRTQFGDFACDQAIFLTGDYVREDGTKDLDRTFQAYKCKLVYEMEATSFFGIVEEWRACASAALPTQCLGVLKGVSDDATPLNRGDAPRKEGEQKAAVTRATTVFCDYVLQKLAADGGVQPSQSARAFMIARGFRSYWDQSLKEWKARALDHLTELGKEHFLLEISPTHGQHVLAKKDLKVPNSLHAKYDKALRECNVDSELAQKIKSHVKENKDHTVKKTLKDCYTLCASAYNTPDAVAAERSSESCDEGCDTRTADVDWPVTKRMRVK